MFHALYHVPVVVAVPFMTFGPEPGERETDSSGYSESAEGEAPRLSSGLWEADWIYVGDVIQGLLDAAIVPGIEGATPNWGQEQNRP